MRPVGCGEESWVVEADLKPDLARIVPSIHVLVLEPLLVLVLALVLGPAPVHQLATWDLGQPVMQGQER